MVETERPYSSCSIEELEALFAVQGAEVLFLSQLVAELAYRKTKRARVLLLSAAKRLAESEEAVLSGTEAEEVGDIEFDHPSSTAKSSGTVDDQARSSQSADRPPDDRKRPKRLTLVRPVGTPGLPNPWIPSLNTDRDLKLEPNAELPQIYVAALAALIDEIRKSGAGQKRYELENGTRTEGDECIYEFPFSNDAELFDDARVEIEVVGRHTDGSIVSIGPGRIWLALGEDFGQVIKRAVILVDATALLEALKQRIESVNKGEIGLNRAIADAAVGKQQQPHDPPPIPDPIEDGVGHLNSAQSIARRRALTKSITYIWGPPGCGKTRVLSEIVRTTVEAGKRILVCSNTNKAVDQVLYQTCRTLKKNHEAMEHGRIVRLGRIADEKLASEYSAYVTVDGIVERRSANLKQRLSELQIEIATIDGRSEQNRTVLDSFNRFDAAERNVAFWLDTTNRIARAGTKRHADHQSTAVKLSELNTELLKRRASKFALFRRSEQAIQDDISTTQARSGKMAIDIQDLKLKYADARSKFDAAKSERDHLETQLRGFDRAAAEHAIVVADKARTSLVSELRAVEIQIGELRASVLKDSLIFGATCTKAYLSVKEIGQVDMVIIDEASMIILPMIWFAAGLSKERLVVCGDFRQIPPIVPTKQQAVFDVLGNDVFTAMGLNDPSVDDQRMVMLDTQYRMDNSICALISQAMYQGKLITDETTRGERGSSPPTPFDEVLTIVDTSDLWPFESVNAFYSRFNLMHALLARNLAWHFQQNDHIREKDSLAICTPYAAQARLIRKMIEGEGLEKLVQVGTVHTFQGDERDTIILELPEGFGGARMIGQFLQGVPPSHTGARLINVAVSRARNHLIILANLTYLDGMLPSSALLRGILYDMQRDGRIVPGEELLALRPIEKDLRGLFDTVPLDTDAETIGLFNQSTFDAAIEADIANAKDSIVIFSGFVTPRRVAALGNLLRSKTANGIKVRCVTRPPKRNGTMDPLQSKAALDTLERIDCTVDCRARIHEKIVLIDKEIVWHGSLNVLSHTHLTDESMTRVVNAGLAGAIAANVSKRRVSSEKILQAVGEAENPRCGDCGSRTVYNDGKFGPFFYCEDECGWRISLNLASKPRKSGCSSNNIPSEGPLCPLCNEKTVLRSGKNGSFFGCVRYPNCKGTLSVE